MDAMGIPSDGGLEDSSLTQPFGIMKEQFKLSFSYQNICNM